MTCIVGVKTPTGVLLGGDCQGSSGWDQRERVDGKVFALGEFQRVAIGFTSSYRMGQILQFHVDLPNLDVEEDEFRWAVAKFIPAARKALKEHGYQKITDSREQAGPFLLAVRRRLFTVGDDLQVGENAAPFDSTGCGEDYAIGALHVLETADLSAREKATRALEAAARWSNGVGSTFTFVETKGTA